MTIKDKTLTNLIRIRRQILTYLIMTRKETKIEILVIKRRI